ncbi:MAG: hypothetical protein ACQERB_15895 [Promethearchaeati archaeon]
MSLNEKLQEKFIIYDSVKKIQEDGEFTGSIITKYKNSNIIFSDKLISKENYLEVPKGLMVGFESTGKFKKEAFSRSSQFLFNLAEEQIDYSLLIPGTELEKFDHERFSVTFPYAINLLHSAGLLLKEENYKINHLDFFKGEILKNPIAFISRGICVADRVVIDQQGDPIFYGTLIIGRDEDYNLSVSYESILNLDDMLINAIIILGIESIKD